MFWLQPLILLLIGTSTQIVTRTQLTACKYCGEDFSSRVVHDKPYRTYCSKTCKGKDQPPVKPWNKGLKRGDHPSIDKIGFQEGESNPMWRGGDSDKERRNAEYKTWRIDVFERDGFKCQRCDYLNGRGKKRRDLNAHHIVRWIDSIALRYEVTNGITMCVPCHRKEHTDKD
jgi:hypothetical protein